MRHLRRFALMWILLLALCLRLVVAFQQDALAPYSAVVGGDEAWYLANGWGMMSGLPHGTIRGITFYVEAIPGAPAYLVMVGLPQMLLPDEAAVRLIFVLQALMGTAICYFACRIAKLLTGDTRAGHAVAFVLAISPAFVMMTGWILSEPLYIFLTTAGIWVYQEFVVSRISESKNLMLPLILIGALFGLAVLTRAVLLVFPLVVALHLLMIFGRRAWRRGVIAAAVLLMSYGVALSTWTIYNLGNFDRFVIGSTQMMAALWRGAVTEDTSPGAMDSLLMPDCKEDCLDSIPAEVYGQQIANSVSSNIIGFIGNRVNELASASFQPYGTAEIGGESLRDLTQHWLREDFSVDGFIRLVNGDNFWLKLLLYLFHYAGMLLGLAGMWLLRRRWHMLFVPAMFIFYTYGLHLLLLALPRYIFPTQVYWWICGAVVAIMGWDIWKKRQAERHVSSLTAGGQDARRIGN